MAVEWGLETRGGAYDGLTFCTYTRPQPVMIVWVCGGCREEHATFNATDPGIVLRTAESYRLVEVVDETHSAVYEIGDSSPGPFVEDEERVLVGAGAGFDEWTPGPEGRT